MRPAAAWLPIACLVAACTFPEVEIGSGGHASTSSATHGATTGNGSSSGGPTTASGSTSGSTSQASSSTGVDPCTACLSTNVCDCDGDGVERFDPTHNCTNVTMATGDCKDCDSLVHPGQTDFFSMSGSNGYDYDCDGMDKPKWAEGSCSGTVDGLSGECAKLTFLQSSGPCGSSVPVVTCKGTGITTPCATNPAMLESLPCH